MILTHELVSLLWDDSPATGEAIPELLKSVDWHIKGKLKSVPSQGKTNS